MRRKSPELCRAPLPSALKPLSAEKNSSAYSSVAGNVLLAFPAEQAVTGKA
jgi:hypothetical protein